MKVAIDHTKRGYVSKVGTSIYHGNVLGSFFKDRFESAYLISKGDPGEIFDGVVVGILNKGDPQDQHLIVAPRGYVYYEPDIRAMLSRVRNQPIHSLQCRYEKSCGAVIFNEYRNKVKFLLVKNRNANHWGFPKGHIERGETESQTAIREIKEETGLQINIIHGFREISDYYSFGSAKKRVVFFLAKSKTWKINLQVEELESYLWATYEEAVSLFEFKNNVIVLKRAVNFLDQRFFNPAWKGCCSGGK